MDKYNVRYMISTLRIGDKIYDKKEKRYGTIVSLLSRSDTNLREVILRVIVQLDGYWGRVEYNLDELDRLEYEHSYKSILSRLYRELKVNLSFRKDQFKRFGQRS